VEIQADSTSQSWRKLKLCFYTVPAVVIREVNTSASYARGPGFKSRLGNRLFIRRFFVVSSSSSRQMPV
jgi:hypothetical protein